MGMGGGYGGFTPMQGAVPPAPPSLTEVKIAVRAIIIYDTVSYRN